MTLGRRGPHPRCQHHYQRHSARLQLRGNTASKEFACWNVLVGLRLALWASNRTNNVCHSLQLPGAPFDAISVGASGCDSAPACWVIVTLLGALTVGSRCHDTTAAENFVVVAAAQMHRYCSTVWAVLGGFVGLAYDGMPVWLPHLQDSSYELPDQRSCWCLACCCLLPTC
jgi:hypothetical protein